MARGLLDLPGRHRLPAWRMRSPHLLIVSHHKHLPTSKKRERVLKQRNNVDARQTKSGQQRRLRRNASNSRRSSSKTQLWQRRHSVSANARQQRKPSKSRRRSRHAKQPQPSVTARRRQTVLRTQLE
jgi:hypothetical protein